MAGSAWLFICSEYWYCLIYFFKANVSRTAENVSHLLSYVCLSTTYNYCFFSFFLEGESSLHADLHDSPDTSLCHFFSRFLNFVICQTEHHPIKSQKDLLGWVGGINFFGLVVPFLKYCACWMLLFVSSLPTRLDSPPGLTTCDWLDLYVPFYILCSTCIS